MLDMSGAVCEPVMKMETRNIAQRYAISFFCIKLSDITTTTHGILQQAFGDDAMSRTQAFLLAHIVF
jgi:hypothetical protein